MSSVSLWTNSVMNWGFRPNLRGSKRLGGGSSWVNEAISGCYDSSSPDGAASSAASKNIVSERNRRKKLNDRLYALCSVVPNISKMDKASIIKDAIDYIQELQEQERRIQEEITVLESTVKIKGIPAFEDYDDAGALFIIPPYLSSKKKRTIAAAVGFCDSAGQTRSQRAGEV